MNERTAEIHRMRVEHFGGPGKSEMLGTPRDRVPGERHGRPGIDPDRIEEGDDDPDDDGMLPLLPA